jgi:hypothetical protein
MIPLYVLLFAICFPASCLSPYFCSRDCIFLAGTLRLVHCVHLGETSKQVRGQLHVFDISLLPSLGFSNVLWAKFKSLYSSCQDPSSLTPALPGSFHNIRAFLHRVVLC